MAVASINDDRLENLLPINVGLSESGERGVQQITSKCSILVIMVKRQALCLPGILIQSDVDLIKNLSMLLVFLKTQHHTNHKFKPQRKHSSKK